MMLQLNPPLPLITPKGKAHAHVLIDPGQESHLYWVCFLLNGECWTFRNPDIRLEDNLTEGRAASQRNTHKSSVEDNVSATATPDVKPKKRGLPAEIADRIVEIIRDVGRPMSRGEIVLEFERRGVGIPYDDKARYIGTVAWRNQDVIENIKGQGYWLRGVAQP